MRGIFLEMIGFYRALLRGVWIDGRRSTRRITEDPDELGYFYA